MTRLARRNKTRWIKLKKKQGFAWKHGRLWSKYRWSLTFKTVEETKQFLDHIVSISGVIPHAMLGSVKITVEDVTGKWK